MRLPSVWLLLLALVTVASTDELLEVTVGADGVVTEAEPNKDDKQSGGIKVDPATIVTPSDHTKSLLEKAHKEEFDPTTEEGKRVVATALDIHISVAKSHREQPWMDGREIERTPEDTAEAKRMFQVAVKKTFDSVDMYSGMRELRAAVLGSGDLSAVDLKAFRKFEEVVLADIYLQPTQKAVATQIGDDADLLEKMAYYREDVTGLIPAFHLKCENLFMVADSEEQAMDELRGYLSSDAVYPEHLKYDTLYNSSLRYLPRTDLVVINMLFHELPILFLRHLAHELHRTKSAMWPTAGKHIEERLKDAAPALKAKVVRRLKDEVVRLSKRKGRTVILYLAAGRLTETKKESDGTEKLRVLRQSTTEGRIIQELRELLGARSLFDMESSYVSQRWAKGSRTFHRVQHVELHAMEVGQDFSQEEWLASLVDEE